MRQTINVGASSDSATPVRRRLFLECTETYSSGLNSGIQRVVRNIASYAAQVGASMDFVCQPVVLRGGQYYALDWNPANDNCCRGSGLKDIAQIWLCGAQYLTGPLLHKPQLRNVARRLRKALYPRALARGTSALWWRLRHERIEFTDSDILLLLDASWNPLVWQGAQRAKAQGAQLGVVAYDLIPIQHPEFVGDEFYQLFQTWLEKVLDKADFFLAISQTVSEDLYQYATAKHPHRTWQRERFGSFRLGAALDMIEARGIVRPEVSAIFRDNRLESPYLTVGTLQPRKNHKLLLDAFEELWKSHPQAKLCLVGKVGWLCETLLQRIRNHPRFGQQLLHFEDLTDTELAYCYQRAKGLLFPSLAEGFGLPIVEALQYGLPVMASDIPIHREVGGDFCTYFSPHAADSLLRLLMEYERTAQPPTVRRPGAYDVLDWQASCRELLEQFQHLAPAGGWRAAA